MLIRVTLSTASKKVSTEEIKAAINQGTKTTVFCQSDEKKASSPFPRILHKSTFYVICVVVFIKMMFFVCEQHISEPQ